MNADVEKFIDGSKNWKEEMLLLQNLLHQCDLKEQLKWKHPCYTVDGKNVVILSPFKDYVSLSFFKGSLMKDPEKVLVAPGENSQSTRQYKFQSLTEIEQAAPVILKYLDEAIQIERSGKKVELKAVDKYDIPEELLEKFNEDVAYKKAFNALTPGRQKGYLLHFSQAKQSSTRKSRILDSENRVMKGKGLRDCICGHSKRMPNCDGSHKFH